MTDRPTPTSREPFWPWEQPGYEREPAAPSDRAAILAEAIRPMIGRVHEPLRSDITDQWTAAILPTVDALCAAEVEQAREAVLAVAAAPECEADSEEVGTDRYYVLLYAVDRIRAAAIPAAREEGRAEGRAEVRARVLAVAEDLDHCLGGSRCPAADGGTCECEIGWAADRFRAAVAPAPDSAPTRNEDDR